MSFLLLMAAPALLVWLTSLALRHPVNLREAMRLGAVAAFAFTGIDHFVNAEARYLPMMPAFFGPLSLPLIWFTGAAELAVAVGLLLPLRVYQRLELPNLRRVAGLALAAMLALVVVANINVAIKGSGVSGLAFGNWYFWLRPLFQPFIIAWVLYASGAIWVQPRSASAELKGDLGQ